MRYILDKKGYIEETAFGCEIMCNDKECTEYIGVIPEGYESLEEWNEYATIQAYKIVNNNLVYDEIREAELLEQQERENKLNRPVTYGDLTKQLQTSSGQLASLYKQAETNQDRIVTATNTKELPICKMTINPRGIITNKIDVVITNKNILKNDAISETIDNIMFKVDKTKRVHISSIDGQYTTTNVQYTICGGTDNTDPIFVLKKDVEYSVHQTIFELVLYNYDGVDREEIYRGSDWARITFTEDKPVTHAVIEIAEGVRIEPHDVYTPFQIEIGNVSTDYVTSEYNKSTIYLDEYEFSKSGLFSSKNTIIGENTIIKNSILDTILYDEGYIELIKSDNTYPLDGDTINSFENTMTAFTIQDTTLKVEYKTNILDSDVQGTIYNDDGIELIGTSGILTNFQFPSGNEYEFVGHKHNYSLDIVEKQKLTMRVEIPQNFVVLSAAVTLKHNNVWWKYTDNNDNINYFWGYSRNLKLYKGGDYSSVQATVGSVTTNIDHDTIYTEILDAFGENGYTPPEPMIDNAKPTSTMSIDIKDYLNVGGNTFVIQSADELTTSKTEKQLAEQTGWCIAYTNVIGYMNYTNKEEVE